MDVEVSRSCIRVEVMTYYEIGQNLCIQHGVAPSTIGLSIHVPKPIMLYSESPSEMLPLAVT